MNRRKISVGKINPENQTPFLKEREIEALLKNNKQFEPFWEKRDSFVIFRSGPTLKDPIYEIQLAWDLGDRLETYAWVWVDALQGELLRTFPE